MSMLSKHQGFEIQRLPRRVLQPAEYNPRFIDRTARRRLKESLEGHGLVETLVWNKRTGNLVSGHQRLALLDELEGPNADFYLDVAVVDLPLEQEKALNVQLNSPGVMGSYDWSKLEKLVQEPGIPLKKLGFDDRDIQQLLGDKGMFSAAADPMAAPVNALKEMAGAGATPPGAAGSADVEPRPGQDIEAIKAAKRKSQERARDLDGDASATDYWVTLVFGDHAELSRFCAKAGIDPTDQYVDGRSVAAGLGLDIS